MAVLREGEVIGIMTEWGMTAIEKMEKVILFDGYMFCGKEEYFPVSSLRGAYGWLFRNGLFGGGIAGMRPSVLCACKVWHRIWGRLRLCKVSVRAA